MEEIFDLTREQRSHEELKLTAELAEETVERISAELAEYRERARQVAEFARKVRQRLFAQLKRYGVNVQPSRQDVIEQLKILRTAGGKPKDVDADFINFDDFVYQTDVLSQTIPPYEVLYCNMEVKQVPTAGGLAYTHRDGFGVIAITPNGDLQMDPDQRIETTPSQASQPTEWTESQDDFKPQLPPPNRSCNKDRFKELYEKYMSVRPDRASLQVQFDTNACADSIQTTDSFPLRLLINNYSQIDLYSLLSKFLLCPLQRFINDVVDFVNKIAKFIMGVIIPKFNAHVHETPAGPTSPPLVEYPDPMWRLLPYVCFVEEFAYKIESMKRAKLCVQPFLNKTYTCGDPRQLKEFHSRYSDQLAMEIVGTHSDKPQVKMMRNSGQWKKFSMYNPEDANFVLMKCAESEHLVKQPLDEGTFDTLRNTIRPVLDIPDDVFLFCGDFASGMVADLQKLVEHSQYVDMASDQLYGFYYRVRQGNADSIAVQDVCHAVSTQLKKKRICVTSIDKYVEFLRDQQAQRPAQFNDALEALRLGLRSGNPQNPTLIQAVLNAQFITGSAQALNAILDELGRSNAPCQPSFNKLLKRVQDLFGVGTSRFTGCCNGKTYEALKNMVSFIHEYRAKKKQLYPLNGCGQVDF